MVLAAPTSVVDVRVYPIAALAPEGVRVTTHVSLNRANLGVRTIVDCSDFYRSTFQQLEGEGGPTVVSMLIDQLPPGACEAYAVLFQRDGKTITSNHFQFSRGGGDF